VGPVGQRLAEILLSLSGVVSFVWVGVLVALGIGLLVGQAVRLPLRRVVNGAVCLLLLSVIVHLGTAPERIHGFPVGGVLAAWVGEISKALFHTVGSAVIFGAAFLSMLLISLERSLLVLMRSSLLSLQELFDNTPFGSRSSGFDSDSDHTGEEIIEVEPEIDIQIDAPSACAVSRLEDDEDDDESPVEEQKTTMLKRIFGSWRRTKDVEASDEPGESTEDLAPVQGFFALQEGAEAANQEELVAEDIQPAVAPEPPAAEGIAQAETQSFDADDPRDYERSTPPPVPGDTVAQPTADTTVDTRIEEAPEAVAAPKPKPEAEAKRPALPAAKSPEVLESDAMRKPTVPSETATDQQLPLSPGVYNLPALSLLNYEPPLDRNIDQDMLKRNAEVLVEKLSHFKVECEVSRIRPGPVVTMYEVKPARGVKISKITTLADDLAMALQAEQIRIVAPIPGRDVVGIEIPNSSRETVFLKEILSDSGFQKNKGKLPLALGKDIFGQPVASDLARMPHLLVAGATGSGKSVAINAFIMSLLYSKTPDEVRLVMIDPKMLELSTYDGIPHLLLPVVTNPQKATLALRWMVGEMERRYTVLKPVGVRNIDGYNAHVDRLKSSAKTKAARESLPSPLPYIVVIIDELADLMMVAGKDVESSIARLAQMARAAGIHLVVATQRPSVDVITGLIKANFPTRMSFRVASKVDSRTVLDAMGAERLLGMGDMLFLPPASSHVLRIHGAYVTDDEVLKVVKYVKSQRSAQYDPAILDAIESTPDEDGDGELTEFDPLYDEAVAVVARSRRATISFLQRELGVGYNRSSRIMEQLESQNVVGRQIGTKAREIFIQPSQ